MHFTLIAITFSQIYLYTYIQTYIKEKLALREHFCINLIEFTPVCFNTATVGIAMSVLNHTVLHMSIKR